MFVAVLWLLSDVLLPFVAGMALAYLLDPIARRAERLGIGRAVSALIVVTLVIVALVVAVMAVAPIVGEQFMAFMDKLPGYLTRLQSHGFRSEPAVARQDLRRRQLSDPGKSAGPGVAGLRLHRGIPRVDLVRRPGGVFGVVAPHHHAGGRLLSAARLGTVVATVDGCIPLQHRDTVHGLARDIDAAIAGFVRGQAVICLILAAFYAIGLTLTGLNFGFLIGLMTGLLSFIPFVGAGTGFLVAAVVAIAQFWPDGRRSAMVVGVFLIGQVLEGYVLSPKLVGAKVGLHPVWMMFALIAFGYLFGFVGLLVAIPLAATIGVLLRFALRKYLESPIYTGRRRLGRADPWRARAPS